MGDLLDALRHRRPGRVLRAIWRRWLFSRWAGYLFWNPLPDGEEPPGPDGLIYRLATRDDLKTLALAFGGYVLPGRLRRWLARDDTWVLVAFDRARPIGLYVFGRQPEPDPRLGPLRLASHQVWVHEVYVGPEERRSGVSLGLRRARTELLRSLGFSEVVGKIDRDNGPSLRRQARVQAPGGRVSYVTCVTLLGLRWRRVEVDARARFAAHVAALPAAARTPARLGG